jgi:excisionase family DNA binding protein
MNETPLLVSVREASRLLNYPRDRLYEAIATGRLAALRIGRSLRIPRDRLAAFVEEELRRQGEGSGIVPLARKQSRPPQGAARHLGASSRGAG